jgi:hypothetical protein
MTTLGINWGLLDYTFPGGGDAEAFSLAQELGCTWFRNDVCWNYIKSGSNFKTLYGKASPTLLSTGGAITSIPLNAALTQAVAAGQSITLVDSTYTHTQSVVSSGAPIGATSIPVTSFTPNFAYTTTSSIFYYDPASTTAINAMKTLAASYGINLLFVVDGCLSPTWTNAATNPQYNGGYPSTVAQFAAAMAWLVSQCPGLHWEIMNEPDLYQYGSGLQLDMTPPQYTLGLKAAYPAMKAADPTCTVHMGPVANISTGSDGYNFLQSCYTDGIVGFFDVLSFHCYAWPGNVTWQLTENGDPLNVQVATDIPALRAAHSDTSPMWLTETGWESIDTSDGAPNMTPALQETYLISWLEELLTLPPIVVMIYQLGDAGGYWGMVDASNVKKPVFAAVQSLFASSGMMALL